MKYFTLLVFIAFQSCIPLKIAPNLEEGKVLKAKKFVPELGNRYVYAFNDPKDANEFYKYVNAKFQISYDDFIGNVEMQLDNQAYYLTFYEVNKETKTINLIPIVVDASMEQKGQYPIMTSAEVSRSGKWYIVLTVTDDKMKDALRPNYTHQENVVNYLMELQEEYLSTSKYLEVYLKSSK